MATKSFLPGSSQMSGKMKELKSKVIARKGPITSPKSPVYTRNKPNPNLGGGIKKGELINPTTGLPTNKLPKTTSNTPKARVVKKPRIY